MSAAYVMLLKYTVYASAHAEPIFRDNYFIGMFKKTKVIILPVIRAIFPFRLPDAILDNKNSPVLWPTSFCEWKYVGIGLGVFILIRLKKNNMLCAKGVFIIYLAERAGQS